MIIDTVLSAQHQMLHLQHCHIAPKEISIITSSLVLVTLSDGVAPIKSSFGSLAPPKSSTSPAAIAAPLLAAFSAPKGIPRVVFFCEDMMPEVFKQACSK